jgi:mono/diheme cytochrome c family protein
MRRLGPLAAVLALAGCGVPRVTPELVTIAQHRDPAASADRLEAARALYVTRCSSCHSLNLPRDYDEREWHEWLPKMGRKAKLDRAQEGEIMAFILAARDLPER